MLRSVAPSTRHSRAIDPTLCSAKTNLLQMLNSSLTDDRLTRIRWPRQYLDTTCNHSIRLIMILLRLTRTYLTFLVVT